LRTHFGGFAVFFNRRASGPSQTPWVGAIFPKSPFIVVYLDYYDLPVLVDKPGGEQELPVPFAVLDPLVLLDLRLWKSEIDPEEDVAASSIIRIKRTIRKPNARERAIGQECSAAIAEATHQDGLRVGSPSAMEEAHSGPGRFTPSSAVRPSSLARFENFANSSPIQL
jgi:hypothetical protein